MPTSYITRLEVDIKGATQSIKKVETQLDKVKQKAANPGGAKSANFFGGLEKQADTLDNLFGKLGGSSLAVADTFKVLRTALIGTGIGALVVLVGELINNFDSLKGAVDGVSGAQEDLLATQQESAALSKEQLTDITDRENILRLEKKTEEEILKIKIKAVDAAIIDQKAALETQKAILETQVEAEKRNKRIIKGIIDFTAAPLKLILMGVDQVGKAFGQDFGLAAGLDRFTDAAAGFVFDPEEVRKEGDAAIKEQEKALTQLENQRAGFILTQQKGAADLRKAREAELNAELEAQRKANEALNKAIANSNQIIRDAIKKQNSAAANALLADGDAAFKILQDQEDLKLSLLQQSAEKEIGIVDAKYIALREKAHGNDALLLELAEANAKEVSDIQDKYAALEIQRDQALREARIDMASAAINILKSLFEQDDRSSDAAKKKAFERNKKLSIAEAVINTYKSISATLATAAANPASVLFPAYPYLQAALIGAQGFAQVRKISQSQFVGSGADISQPPAGGSASIGSGGGAPSFNPVNTDFINNRPPQPVLAYTLAGNVSSAQEADQKVKDQARL